MSRVGTKTACRLCKLKHRKCNGASPCSFCIKQKADCTYDEESKQQLPQRERDSSLPQKGHQQHRLTQHYTDVQQTGKQQIMAYTQNIVHLSQCKQPSLLFSDMLSYVEAFSSTMRFFLGNINLKLDQNDFQDLLSATANPKTALNFAVIGMGSTLLQDKYTSRAYIHSSERILSTIPDVSETLFASCATLLLGYFYMTSELGPPNQFFKGLAGIISLKSGTYSDLHFNQPLAITVSLTIFAMLMNSFSADPKILLSCSKLVPKDALVFISDSRCALDAFAAMPASVLNPLDREFFQLMILECRIATQPLQCERILSSSGRGRAPTLKMIEELTALDELLESICIETKKSNSQMAIRNIIIYLNSKAIIKLLLDKRDEALEFASRTLELFKSTDTNLSLRVTVWEMLSSVNIFLVCYRMDKVFEVCVFLFFSFPLPLSFFFFL
eukprot:TRINITY_DN7655_c0_g1_i8.p1 TRINITY_DN7655_c0_g1~~TRINITY_DN7655_c0_g1_i8.p1  ORF type:complete len:443 (+),score=41.25 TRINITY_DN7655_c0_g1_i8:150-1478(+)